MVSYSTPTKAEIRPESRAALDEIAKYLRGTPNVKLDVVGHTDNIRSYDSNLDLSRARSRSGEYTRKRV